MRRRIDVRYIGYDGARTSDAGGILRAAFETARIHAGPTTIVLPPGDYHVWPETTATRELYVSNTVGAEQDHRVKSIGLLLEGQSDLHLEARGARLLVHGRQTAIAIVDSRNVTVRGLEIDWAVPTVIDVTVEHAGVEGGRSWRVLSVPACTPFRVVGTSIEWHSEPSPFTGELYWTGRDGLAYSQVHDPTSGVTRRDRCPLFDDVESIERIDERRVRVVSRGSQLPTDEGLVYQLREIVRDHPGMLVLESEDVVLEDLQVRFLHGFGLVAQSGSSLTLDRVAFRTPSGLGRVSAGFADFVQCSSMSGDILIRDCVFDGPHDDPINIHGTYLAVVEVPRPDELVLEYRHPQTAGFAQFSPGDTVELLSRDTLQPVFTSAVIAVEGPSGRDHDSSLLTMRVRLERAAPVDVESQARRGELAAENTTRTPQVTIIGCRFRSSPTRAILVTTRRPILISGCEFDAIAMPCIQIAADARDWWESGAVTEASILGNTFHAVSAGVLQVAPGSVPGGPPVHGSVTFAGNAVELAAPLLAELRGLARFTASGNTFRRMGDYAAADVVVLADSTVRIDWSTSITQPRPTIRPV